MVMRRTPHVQHHEYALAAAEVLATADRVRRWFEERELPATPADIVAMTGLILSVASDTGWLTEGLLPEGVTERAGNGAGRLVTR